MIDWEAQRCYEMQSLVYCGLPGEAINHLFGFLSKNQSLLGVALVEKLDEEGEVVDVPRYILQKVHKS